MKVIFLKKTMLNKKFYEKGDTLNVSDSISARLIARKEAKEDNPRAKAKAEKKD